MGNINMRIFISLSANKIYWYSLILSVWVPEKKNMANSILIELGKKLI